MKACGIVILILLSWCLKAQGQLIADMGMARDWCDRSMLQTMEGIWEFPADETKVLVKQSPSSTRRYDLIVIETPDTRLIPGELIGTLSESVVSSKFELDLCRNRVKGILSNPGKCMAQYLADEDALVISERKLKISLSPRWLLPSFWRSIRVNLKRPANELPKGMVRIYPTSKPRKIDYL